MRHPASRASALALVALTLAALTGCVSGGAQLQGFSDCADYEAYMRGRPWESFDLGLLGGDLGFDLDSLLVADLGPDGGREVSAGGIPEPGEAGADAWTGTTLQEEDVDEADLVAFDGTWLYAVSGGQLVVSQGWPLDLARQVAVLSVDGDAVGLYLHERSVVVLSTLEPGVGPDSRSDAAPFEGEGGWRDAPATVVTVVDVTQPADPRPVRETYTTGVLRESRRIGATLYVVTTEEVGEVRGPDDPAAFRSLRFDNRATDGGWTSDSEPACGCGDIVAPAGGVTEPLLTHVLSLDLSDPTSTFGGAALVGPAGVVYASPGSLYVASSVAPEVGLDSGAFSVAGGAWHTELHRFDLTGGEPVYDASASVPGLIPDRFGLSEHQGVLRVATQDTASLTSGVTTLQAVGGSLEELDRLEGLAPGEALTAARFVGDLGYLVTYVERVDPLFTLDLSDPEALSVGGELSISGWSDYLHPMMEQGMLLSVGTDFELDGTPVLTASVFDVRDPARPRLHDRLPLDADTSEASDDHHAFTYDPRTGYATLPSTRDGRTVLEVFRTLPDQRLDPVGRLVQPAYGGREAADCRALRRSIHVEDQVWAWSPAGLTAAPLRRPDRVSAEVPFEGVDPCVGLTEPDQDEQLGGP